MTCNTCQGRGVVPEFVGPGDMPSKEVVPCPDCRKKKSCWDKRFGVTIKEFEDCSCPVRIAEKEANYRFLEFGPPISIRFNITWIDNEHAGWLAKLLSRQFMSVREAAIMQTKMKMQSAFEEFLATFGKE